MTRKNQYVMTLLAARKGIAERYRSDRPFIYFDAILRPKARDEG